MLLLLQTCCDPAIHPPVHCPTTILSFLPDTPVSTALLRGIAESAWKIMTVALTVKPKIAC